MNQHLSMKTHYNSLVIAKSEVQPRKKKNTITKLTIKATSSGLITIPVAILNS